MDIKLKLREYLDKNLELPVFEDRCFGSTFKARACKAKAYDMSYESASIDDILDNIDENNKFTNVLFRFIDSKGCKDSDIYNKAQVDRRLFSKIRSDVNYHPKKETVIQLGLALELSTSELEELLGGAGYALPRNNKFDLIIRFCFEEHIYDVFKVNELLEDYDCKLLVKE